MKHRSQTEAVSRIDADKRKLFNDKQSPVDINSDNHKTNSSLGLVPKGYRIQFVLALSLLGLNASVDPVCLSSLSADQ